MSGQAERTGNGQSEDICQSDIVLFPEGLVGCENWKRFTLVRLEDDESVQLLHSVDEPEIAFLVIDPTLLVPDYRCPLTEYDRAQLELENEADAVVLCTLTVHGQPENITANLLGPLVLNLRAGLGRQLVLADSNYSTSYPVPRGDEPANDWTGMETIAGAGTA